MAHGEGMMLVSLDAVSIEMMMSHVVESDMIHIGNIVPRDFAARKKEFAPDRSVTK